MTTLTTPEFRASPVQASRPEIGKPGLAVPTLSQRSDGIAYVGALLQRALLDIAGSPPLLLPLRNAGSGRVSIAERIAFTARLARHQLTGRADWWLFNHLAIARAIRILPQRLRQPYAILLHGIEAWNPNLGESHLQSLHGASVIIANSEFTANRTSATHQGLPAVIPCQLGLLPATKTTDEPDKALLNRIRDASVLILGRMSAAERYKGHDQLLECWSAVIANAPYAQLIVGGLGDDAPRLQRKAGELGISESVFFTGFISAATLEKLWTRVGVFCMPSSSEGFGLVYLEAMRAGLPCIGSTLDAAGEIISDEETGYLVDRDDRADLASAIVRLLTDTDRRRDMGAAGRNRYEAHFTYDHFVERLRPILVSTFAKADRRS